MSGVEAFARAQQVGGQAACQLHLVLNVAIVVEVPVEAIPAEKENPLYPCIPLHYNATVCQGNMISLHCQERKFRLKSRWIPKVR